MEPKGLTRRAKILESLRNQGGGAGVGVSVSVEFHGAIAAEVSAIEDAEGASHIDAEDLALLVGFHVLDMADAVSVLEHGGDTLVGVILATGGQGVAKVRIGMKPRAVHLFD